MLLALTSTPLYQFLSLDLGRADVVGGVLGRLLLAVLGGGWWFHRKTVKALRDSAAAEAEQVIARHDSERRRSAAAAAAAATAQKEAADFRSRAEAAYRQTTERIAVLEADLRQAQEVAAMLPPAQLRIGDLEKALNAERGHLSALEQTLATITRRADELDAKLRRAEGELAAHRQQAEQREADLGRQLALREKEFAEGRTRAEEAGSTASKAVEELANLREQSEKRIAALQRNLSAAEARAAMVQKEFMTAVGVAPDAAAAIKRTPSPQDPVSGDAGRRIRELEDALKNAEAEGRKKAREDGYKIAELEFRLTEARDAVAKGQQAISDMETTARQAVAEVVGKAKQAVAEAAARERQAASDAAANGRQAAAHAAEAERLRAEVQQLKSALLSATAPRPPPEAASGQDAGASAPQAE